MVADLRIIRRQQDLLLECAAGARDALLDTWKRSVPPLFARAEDVTDGFTVLGVYGPQAATILSSVLTEPVAIGSAEHDLLHRSFREHDVLLLATEDNAAGGFDVIVPRDTLAAIRSALAAAGARPMGISTLDVLRIEAGRPRWGAELDDGVIPLEAGLLERAISTSKGCYTGQEVIIRILHRGHVNRHLRGILLGTEPPPARGTTLHSAGDAKPVGLITSAARSPAHRQTIALAYVRREIEPPASLRLGSPDGPAAEVVKLPFEASS
jgi:folate-binding protein YgfZ